MTFVGKRNAQRRNKPRVKNDRHRKNRVQKQRNMKRLEKDGRSEKVEKAGEDADDGKFYRVHNFIERSVS